MKLITPLGLSLALASTLTVQSALHAQQLPIQPAADGTGTIVNASGNTFNITGGTTSSSGANLFQSFTNFGLSSGQVANFLSAPNTQNILSRVTGGNFSLIDGLLKVTGSNANLFLVNPSGIIFGPNASLNVPAAFTATTANGVAFGSQWFNALGQNDYASLNGPPTALGFTASRPGAIINAGNLSVGPGQALSLIGGTVVSTGQLSGGQVTLAAVPGERYVRLGQPGSPLSIEVPMSGAQMPTNWDLPIYSLPELLTGTGAGLTVAEDGTVQLVGSQLTVKNGDVVARKIDAASAVLSASRNVTLPESQLATTKDLLIQAKDTVTVRDSKENPVLVKAGGNLTIQGDKSVDLLALNYPGQAFQSGGDLRLVSDGNVSGDARFGSGGNFSIETLAGKPGNFVSLYDPIISSGTDVSFGDYTGVSLKVESGGSITGGNIRITGRDTVISTTDADTGLLATLPALILRAGVPSLGNTTLGNTAFTSGNLTTSPGNITVGSLETNNSFTSAPNGGPIILAAPGNITINGIVNAGNSVNAGVTVNTPGTATFNNGVNANNLTTDAGGLTILNGSVTTVGSQTYNDDVQINKSLTLTSTDNGSLTLGGTVNSQPGSTNSLLLNIDPGNGSGNIAVKGPVGNTQPLGNLVTQTTNTATFGSSVSAGFFRATRPDGLTVLNGNVTTVNGQEYSTPVRLNNSATLLSTGNFSGITFNRGVQSSGDLTVNAPRIFFNTFNGSNVSVNNLITNSAVTSLGSNVTSIGSQTYNSNEVQLTGSVTLASPNSGNITFGGMIDSQSVAQGLTVNTQGGNITLGGSVGSNRFSPLRSLTLNTGNNLSSGIIALNGNVKTLDSQTYNNKVQLNNSVTLTSTNNGRIAFGDTVNSQPGATNSLAVNTKGGNAVLIRPVGNTQPLGDLTVSAGNISLAEIGTREQAGVTGNTNLQTAGTLNFNGNIYNANTQNYVGNSIALNAGNTTTFTSSADPITFQGPIALNNSGLTIASASTITTDSIGGSRPINFTAANRITTGNIATNGGSIDLTSGGTIRAGTINSGTANGGGAPITLRQQGRAFFVNNSSLGAPDDSSSSGTISSRPDNVISQEIFMRDFNQDNIAIFVPAGPDPDGSGTSPGQLTPSVRPPTSSTADSSMPLPPRRSSSNEPSSLQTVRSFEKYFGQSFDIKQLSIPELQDNLRRIEKASGKKLSFINVDIEAKVFTLITPEDNTTIAIPRNVTSEALREKATELRREIADPRNVTSNRYLTTSRQLYGWLIAPLDKYLKEKKVDTLIFQLDAGLRLMPLAALNDGQQFLVEKYSLSLIPSINLLDTRYEPERVRSSKVLAMGATTFKDDAPLPEVPAELQNVSQYGGSVFLNDKFTLANLKAKADDFRIIHLATYADFGQGAVQNSSIQLGDTRLSLKQMRDLGWDKQNVELLVLSDSRTAFGDVNTELGFAGLATEAGVKTAVATLWNSSELGTLGFMSAFYQDLKTASIKADALRSAQVAMLRGEVRIEDGQLRFKKSTVPLTADLKALGEVRLTHPHYWSGFTMIGSPW
jgi:filamentous hemagglutinin family protein